MTLDLDPTDGLPSRAALARELLLYKMKEYSQDGFCATWLVGLEFELWEAADRENPTEREFYTVSTSKECRLLAEIAGGWWAWLDELGPGERGPVFMTLAEWSRNLDHRAATKRK